MGMSIISCVYQNSDNKTPLVHQVVFLLFQCGGTHKNDTATLFVLLYTHLHGIIKLLKIVGK